MLSQTGNPVYAELTTYTSWLSSTGDAAAKLTADKTLADNMITWQLPDNGGFYKNAKSVYAAPWNGTAARSGWLGAGGVELGTIDNDATVTELLFLANVYQRTKEAKYKQGASNALDFLLKMQYSSGGFPQVYPARVDTTYSNHVTFNDDAMARVMILLDHAVQQKSPLDGDIFTADQRAKLATAIDKGVDYILKAQIVQNGVKTVWCAQHDPVSYAPQGARAYELPSKSGKESVLVTAFLMTRPQTTEVKAAVQAAIAWYKSSAVQLKDTYYSKTEASAFRNPFIAQTGTTTWYRFYDLDQDKGFFSDRTAVKFYDIMQIEQERLAGYEWGGSYGSKLFTYSNSVGY